MSNDANKFAQLRAVAIAAETYAELGHWPKIAPLLKEIRLLLPQCRAEMNNAKAQAKQSRTSDDITTVEAARRLNITLSRLHYYRRHGRLSARFENGSTWLFSAAEVANFQRKPRGWKKGQPRKNLADL